MTDAPLPDAARGNWVDALAPPPLRPWLKLGRFDRPAGVWLLMLPGWQGIALADAGRGRPPELRLLLLFALGALVMRAAGCAFNDVVDRDLDRRVARTAARPVASGAISRRAALGYAVGLSLLGLAILLQLPPLAIGLGAASVALVAAYPFMKRLTWWPQAWLGLTFNWPALVGFAAAQGAPVWQVVAVHGASGAIHFQRVRPEGAPAWQALLLYASGVAWTLGYDTIYALQDLEDDALAGVKSSARRLGGGARRGVAGFYALSALLALAALVAPMTRAALAADLLRGRIVTPYAVMLWAGFAAHLAWQARRVRVDDPAGALRLFKSNREAGLLLFAACALTAVGLMPA